MKSAAEKIQVITGDCTIVLDTLEENSIDSCVTDPPYHLVSIVKRFGKPGSSPHRLNDLAKGKDDPYVRASAGFMGKQWDGGDVAFRPETWAKVYRVLKPGAHLLAFGGDRTFHRMACAIEDAGFEYRGTIAWLYGQGFPKNLNVSKKMREYFSEDVLCACGPRESRTVQDFPNDYLSCHHSGGEQPQLVIDNGQDAFPFSADVRAHSRDDQPEDAPDEVEASIFLDEEISHHSSDYLAGHALLQPEDCQDRDNIPSDISLSMSRDELMAAHKSRDHKSGISHSDDGLEASARYANLSRCPHCGKYKIPEGLGNALKPSMELIALCRKPLSEPTIAANVLKWGTGAINVDGCRVESSGDDVPMGWESPRGGIWKTDSEANAALVPNNKGRWPANVIHDGSEEVVEGFPETVNSSNHVRHNGDFKSPSKGYETAHETTGPQDNGSAARFFYQAKPDNGRDGEPSADKRYTDEGSTNFAATPGRRREPAHAARFFYTSKADSADRIGSKHPTVKPLDLMQYLVRLVTPKSGVVLDCFAGTGTTGEAAFREGMRAILIERDEAYLTDINRRIALCLSGPEEKAREIIKEKMKGKPLDSGPLFSDWDKTYL